MAERRLTAPLYSFRLLFGRFRSQMPNASPRAIIQYQVAKPLPPEPLPAPALELGEDYYLENGRVVFTAKYHLRRGHCCNSGCRHCPYRNNKNLSPMPRVDILPPRKGDPPDEP